MGIQMSKVPSESAFDVVGKKLDHDHGSLSAATLQALMRSHWNGSGVSWKVDAW